MKQAIPRLHQFLQCSRYSLRTDSASSPAQRQRRAIYDVALHRPAVQLHRHASTEVAREQQLRWLRLCSLKTKSSGVTRYTTEAVKPEKETAQKDATPDGTSPADEDEHGIPDRMKLTEKEAAAFSPEVISDGMEWVKHKEREKILDVAVRLRQKRQHIVTMSNFARSLSEMPEIKEKDKYKVKVEILLRRLRDEDKELDKLFERMADLLAIPYHELKRETEPTLISSGESR